MIELLGACLAGGLSALVVVAAVVRFGRGVDGVRRHGEFFSAYQVRPFRDPEPGRARRLTRERIGPGGKRRRR